MVRFSYNHDIAMIGDLLYYAYGLIIWSMVELGIGVIVLLTITLRPLAIKLGLIPRDEDIVTPLDQEQDGICIQEWPGMPDDVGITTNTSLRPTPKLPSDDISFDHIALSRLNSGVSSSMNGLNHHANANFDSNISDSGVFHE